MQAGYPLEGEEIYIGGSGGFKMGPEPWSINILIRSPSKNTTFSKANILIVFK